MKAYIAPLLALGAVHEAIEDLEPAYAKGHLNDAACLAYLDLIDARFRLERALEPFESVSEAGDVTVTDDDYNLRGF